MKKYFYFIFLTLFNNIFFQSCNSDFPLNERIYETGLKFQNQDAKTVVLMDDAENRIKLVGFVFTHCPDICPMTINNMKLVQESLLKEGISDPHFIAITFDPERDSIPVLKKYLEIREVNESNFEFLTGTTKNINKLVDAFGVFAAAGDTTYIGSEPSYFFTHTDRIALVDQKNRIRKEYQGSVINIDEIVNDIKKLR